MFIIPSSSYLVLNSPDFIIYVNKTILNILTHQIVLLIFTYFHSHLIYYRQNCFPRNKNCDRVPLKKSAVVVFFDIFF